MHAIALPDVTVHQLVLAPDAPREILLDRTDVREGIGPAIARVLDYHRGARERRRPPGEEGAAMLRELLAPSVSLRVPMAEEILDEEAALIQLTSEQSLALARLGRNRRLVVYGCAGSGKTMLAVEHAKRLARTGKAVLFVCFNRALVEHLRRTERKTDVAFFTFHSLCTHLAHKAKVKLPQYPPGEAPPEYFDDELPDALIDAIGVLGGQYDALIVDEAQDLHDNWFAALQITLREESRAAIWLFMDDNQRVYGEGFTVPDDYMSFELTVNCRNTQAIHREVMKLYEGQIVPEVRGPPGRPVELFHTDDQPTTVAGVIERLCGAEEILPQDVVVLSSHGRENSEVGRRPAWTICAHARTREARQVRPVLLDPRVQGARVAGRDPLRARGPGRGDVRPAALRRAVPRAQPLRDRRTAGTTRLIRHDAPRQRRVSTAWRRTPLFAIAPNASSILVCASRRAWPSHIGDGRSISVHMAGEGLKGPLKPWRVSSLLAARIAAFACLEPIPFGSGGTWILTSTVGLVATGVMLIMT